MSQEIKVGDRVKTDYGNGVVNNFVLGILANVLLDDGLWLLRPPAELTKLEERGNELND